MLLPMVLCILIENDENYGWAKGNNIGIEYSLKNGADYVLLCNNDILLKDNDVITKLVSTVEDNIEYSPKEEDPHISRLSDARPGDG